MSSRDVRKPAPTDRRGISSNGRLLEPQHKLSNVKGPCGLLILAMATVAQLAGLQSTGKNPAIAGPLRSFSFSSFSSKKKPEVDLTIADGRVASFNGEVVWPLNDTAEIDSWVRLERTIDAIIARTPAKEYEFTPSVLVEAYRLGESRDNAQPTVLIRSSSRKHAVQLGKTLKRSGVLKTAAVPFQVAIRDLENEMDVSSSNMTTVPVHSAFIAGARAVPV